MYRDEFDLLLRNQTSETAVKAQKKWRSRAKKTGLASNASATSATSPSSSSGADSPRSKQIKFVVDIPPSVNVEQSIIDLAEKRFFFDFVIEEAPQAPKTGYATFVPDMISNAGPGSCAYHAFRATSLSNFAARSKSPQAAEMAWKEYGKTIKLLSPDLSSSRGQRPVQTLSAVCLLSLYEILATPFLSHGGSWQAHVNGSCALLNSFYASGQGSAEDIEALSELFQHIITQMLINRMTFGKRPEIPLSTVDVFIRPKTIMHQVLSLIYKAADKLASWREAEMNVADPVAVSMAAMKMVSDADEMVEEIEQWFRERPPVWEEEIREIKVEHMPTWLQPLYRSHGAPSTMRVSSNLLIAQRYNLLRGTQIQMHCHALNALDVLIAGAQTDSELAFWLESQQRFELRVMTHINDILSAIYGHMTLPIRGKAMQKTLDDVPTLRIILLLWPLYRMGMLMARRETMAAVDPEGRRFWARNFLCWARDEVGVKKCEAFVNNIDGNFGLTYC